MPGPRSSTVPVGHARETLGEQPFEKFHLDLRCRRHWSSNSRELLDEQRAAFIHYGLGAELRMRGRARAVSEAERLGRRRARGTRSCPDRACRLARARGPALGSGTR